MIHFKRLEIPNNANIAILRMKNCDDKHRKMFLYLTKKPNYLKKNKNKSITEKKTTPQKFRKWQKHYFIISFYPAYLFSFFSNAHGH